jgi:replicative DNA helicase
MEMTKEQLIRRMISSLATVVTAKDIRDPRWMHEAEFQDMLKTSNILERFPIHIDDSRQLPLDVLIARAKAAMYRDGVKLIIVDYIQIVRSMTKARNQNDTERIEATTLALRDLAAESKAFGVHVIGLSQYSRPADGGKAKAENRRAKGSSSLEQSCQAMFHIVRDMLEDGSLSTDVEIVVGKQREGRFGRIKCIFDENHLRFKTTTLI